MSKKLIFVPALILLCAAAVFAGGQSEHSKVSVTGTIVSVTNPSNGNIKVSISSSGTTYTVVLPAADAAKLHLQQGKTVTVHGMELSTNDNGTVSGEIAANTVTSGGVEYDAHSGDVVPPTSLSSQSDGGDTHSDGPDFGQSHDASHDGGGGDNHSGGHDR